jgi:hypothetical protein
VTEIEKLIERLTWIVLDRRGFHYAPDPMEFGQDAYDITNDMRDKITAQITEWCGDAESRPEPD